MDLILEGVGVGELFVDMKHFPKFKELLGEMELHEDVEKKRNKGEDDRNESVLVMFISLSAREAPICARPYEIHLHKIYK